MNFFSRCLKEEDGQSTIEFISSLIFALVIVFVFFKLAINIASGYLVHYSTFMASRSYLVIDNNSNSPEGADGEAEKRAKAVFSKLGGLLDSITPGKQYGFTANDPQSVTNKAFVGIWSQYFVPFGVSDLIGGKEQIKMRSESFLGREPTIAECLAQVCAALKDTGGGRCNSNSTIFDNGC